METTTTTETTTESSKASERFRYPVREFSYILGFCIKIYKELGHTEYHDAKRIAEVHGLKEDSIKQVLSTSQQYGLLELKHGTGYKITNLFLKIEKYTSESQREEGIIEALSSPQVFKELFEPDRIGHAVPSQKALANTFERKGLKEANALKTAEIFYENLKEYKLLNINNELTLTPKTQEHASLQVYEPKNAIQHTEEAQVISSDTITILIPLKGKSIDAKLVVPRDYSSKDLKKISKFVEALIDDDE